MVNGIIYFLARSSPEIAAESNWGVDTVPSDALPKLRSSSDLTWAFWNQVASGTNSLQNIKYFIAMQITNDETLEIVMRALKAMGVPDGEAKLWPGTAFTVGAENDAEKEAADALIGECRKPLDRRPTDYRMARQSQWSGSRLLSLATQATARWRKVYLEGGRVRFRSW